MNLTTNYLGLRLPGPFIVGASPLASDLDMARRLEDQGAAALIMPSLFEEQLRMEEEALDRDLTSGLGTSAEALSYFPGAESFPFGPEAYLGQVRRLKEALSIPVIASLNGSSLAGWAAFARRIQEAGADALELNLYHLATSPLESGVTVEQRAVDAVRAVKRVLDIPVAVKLSPFFSSLPYLARLLEDAGADALVLFNRFYQPDIDIEALEAAPTLRLSDSSELLLRLRWLAILHGQLRIPLAATGGVHTPEDAVKGVMAGASALQVVSALLRGGPGQLRVLREGLLRWMEEHEYESLEQMRGSMSLRNTPDPGAFERANYMRVLQGWRAS